MGRVDDIYKAMEIRHVKKNSIFMHDYDEQDHELTQSIIDAVMSLPYNVREAVILRHYHGMSFSQMSEILETPVTTLAYRTLQGLKKLQEKFNINSDG